MLCRMIDSILLLVCEKDFLGRSNLKNDVPVQQFACSLSFVADGTFLIVLECFVASLIQV